MCATIPRNIILITIDCLRADAVGCIRGGNLTPNIDKLARESLVFTKAFTNGPGTPQAFPAILTSTYLFMHETIYLEPWYITISEILQKHGYRTVAFHSNPYLSRAFGWNKGFQEFYDFLYEIALKKQKRIVNIASSVFNRLLDKYALLESLGQRFSCLLFYKKSLPYYDAGLITKYAIEWLERSKRRKFFMWIHYMDPHFPYAPPKPWLRSFKRREEALLFNYISGDVKILRQLYEDEVRYVDSCIGELLDYMDRRKMLDETLVVITADHGEAFAEHGSIQHRFDILYNETLHVPLIIYGATITGRSYNAVQLLDLAPTILALCDIDKPFSFMGETLIDNEQETVKHGIIFSESANHDLHSYKFNYSRFLISCIYWPWKLIYDSQKGVKIFDLEHDFEERNDLSIEREDIVRELMELIRKHMSWERKKRLIIKLRYYKGRKF